MSKFLRFKGDHHVNARYWLDNHTAKVKKDDVKTHFERAHTGDADNCVLVVATVGTQGPLTVIYIENEFDFARISSTWRCLGWHLVDRKDLFDDTHIKLV